MKKAWRTTLTKWKTKNKGVVPKMQFPTLLKEMLDSLQPTIRRNISSGFEAAGIIPLNPQQVFKRIIPQGQAPINLAQQENAFVASLTEVMAEKITVAETCRPKRNKKITVEPGKSVCMDDFDVDDGAGPSHDLGNDSAGRQTPTSHEGNGTPDYDSDTFDEYDDNTGPLSSPILKTPVINCDNIVNGCFIVVNFIYNEKTKNEITKSFVAKVSDIGSKKNKILVNCLRSYKQKKNCFVFPQVEDTAFRSPKQIECLLVDPIILRGIHTFPGAVL